MIERRDMDGVAVIRLAHGKVNALDLELLRALVDTFGELASDDSAAVVLTGAGGCFSAGVDLKRAIAGGPGYLQEFLPALSAAFLAVFTSPKPVVAAVNGHAIAGGCVFTCACDHRLMADGRARIGVPELLVGVPFPAAAWEIIRYGMGSGPARAAALGAGTYPPAEAVRRGYVDEVVAPDVLLERALAVADRLGHAVPADTFAHTKAQLQREVRERLAGDDGAAETLRLWMLRVQDGWIGDYLTRTVGGANR